MRISDWSSDVCSSDLFGLRFIEALLLRRFVPQPCRRQETGAITLRQLIGLTNKFLDSDRVDIADRATRPCRETPALDSAKIRILRRLQHTLLQPARSFHGLRVEDALFQILDVLTSFRGKIGRAHV